MESGSALPWHIILFLHLTTCAIQAVVASLISAPKIELHHKAVLGRLAYEIKVRQQCMLIPSFLPFCASHSGPQQVAGPKRTHSSQAL